jgi:glycosyltransferase involved in cell wall biosynthesis
MESLQNITPLFWRTGFYGALTEGGVGTLYYSLTNEFVKKLHKVHFASGGPMRLPNGVQHHLIEYSKIFRNLPEVHNLTYNYKSSKKIKELIYKENIDFIYLHHHDFHFGGYKVKKETGIPIILHVDSVEYWVKKNWGKLYLSNYLKWCEQIEVKAIDALIVISDILKEQLIEFYNVDESKIYVSPNGVDTDLFNPQKDSSAIREKYGLEDSIVIGYSGGFNVYHGIETLIKASKIILNKIQNAKIFLIGDGELRKFVDEFAEKNKIKDKIIVTGLVPLSEVPQYLAACDLLVSPFTFKSTQNQKFFGSPIKIFEYMAMGKPIVTTNIGLLARICLDEINSLVMEEDNPNSLAEKVFKILEEPLLAKQLGENAREFVVKNYSWSKKYDLIMEIYNKLK